MPWNIFSDWLPLSLVCWCALAVLACITAAYLHYLNKQQEKKRVALGKPEKVIDTSILSIEDAAKVRTEINQREGVTIAKELLNIVDLPVLDERKDLKSIATSHN